MPEDFPRLQSALADRYTLERELGSGGMATAYLAHDVRHNLAGPNQENGHVAPS